MRPGRPKTIASTAAVAFGGQLLTHVLALLGTLIVSRALGPSGRGEFAVALAAASSSLAICLIGLEFANTYFYAQKLYGLRAIARVATAAALLMAPVALLLQVGFFMLTRETVFAGIGATAVLVAAFSVPVGIHLNWLMGLFQLGSRLVRSQAALLAGAGAQFSGVLVLALLGELTVVTALLLYALNVTVAWLLHMIWGTSFLTLKPSRDRAALRRVIAYGLRLHPGFLFWYLLLRADILLVNALLGTREAGLYSIAVVVAEVILILSTPVAAAVLPAQAQGGISQSATLTFKAVRCNCALAAALAVLFASTMWLMIPLVFGPPFAPAYEALLALLPGMVFMAAYRPLYNWLLREDRTGRMVAIGGASFGANVLLNLGLLPLLGIVGAGVASSVAYGALAAGMIAWGLRVGNLSVREALLLRREDVETFRRQGGLALSLGRRMTGRPPKTPAPPGAGR